MSNNKKVKIKKLTLTFEDGSEYSHEVEDTQEYSFLIKRGLKHMYINNFGAARPNNKTLISFCVYPAAFEGEINIIHDQLERINLDT